MAGRSYRKKWNVPSSRENTRTIKRIIKFNSMPSQARYRKRAQAIARALNPLPPNQTVSLRYVENINLAPGAAGVPAQYVWRCNGPYDPNMTGVGHQPMFWDTYASMYNHYVVTGAKIKAVCWCEQTAQVYGAVVGIKIDDDATVSQNVMTIMELKDPIFRNKFMNVSANSTHALAKVTHTYDPKSFFGIKDVEDNRDNIGALTNTTPSEQAYWVLHWQHVDGSTTFPSNLKGYVIIDYTINFSEPKDQSSN